MNRASFSAIVLAVAVGTTVNASAKNTDHYDAHKSFERREHHEQVRNHDGDRWAREHHNDQRRDSERERRQQEAMHRWDREHHRKPMTASHHEPKHGQYKKHNSYVNHHYDRHRTSPANQQVMNHPPRDGRTALVAR